MSNIQTTETSPAIINVSGATKSERQLSVVYAASGYTKMALANSKGKMGLAARNGIANGGLQAIAKQAAWPTCNYKPAAEYFAARLGKDFIISGRSTFESLADQFEMTIMAAKQSKNGGYVLDKKTGAQKPSAAHALGMELKAIAIELIEQAAQYTADAKLKAADAKLQAQALTA
jgi:hypothetical protein